MAKDVFYPETRGYDSILDDIKLSSAVQSGAGKSILDSHYDGYRPAKSVGISKFAAFTIRESYHLARAQPSLAQGCQDCFQSSTEAVFRWIEFFSLHVVETRLT